LAVKREIGSDRFDRSRTSSALTVEREVWSDGFALDDGIDLTDGANFADGKREFDHSR